MEMTTEELALIERWQEGVRAGKQLELHGSPDFDIRACVDAMNKQTAIVDGRRVPLDSHLTSSSGVTGRDVRQLASGWSDDPKLFDDLAAAGLFRDTVIEVLPIRCELDGVEQWKIWIRGTTDDSTGRSATLSARWCEDRCLAELPLLDVSDVDEPAVCDERTRFCGRYLTGTDPLA